MSFHKEYAKIIAKCWQDENFKKEFIKNPEKVLQDNGIKSNDSRKIKVVEDDDKTMHLVLYQQPKEISEQELEAFAAGGCVLGEGAWGCPDWKGMQ